MEILKNYNIPIKWESYKRISVEAENLQEATEKALKIFLDEPDDLYLDDSFEIDKIIEEETNETFDTDITIENVFK
jgi:hypothetical protein